MMALLLNFHYSWCKFHIFLTTLITQAQKLCHLCDIQVPSYPLESGLHEALSSSQCNHAGFLDLGKGVDQINSVILTVFPYISLLSLLYDIM